MSVIVGRFSLFLLLILPTTFMLAGPDGSPSMVVRAADDLDDDLEDALEEEEDGDATVETDEGTEAGPDVTAMEGDAAEEEEEEEKPMKPSDDANTFILFTKPLGTDFPAGKLVKFLVGFVNMGDKDFVVETMDAAFRYPQDYSYYIQNFTAVNYDHLVEPNKEATFEYSFLPSDSFSARPFGLTVNLNYKDSEGNFFQDAVFNDTINVIEADEGLDGETFFLYVFLAAVGALILLGAHQLFSSFGKKHIQSKPKHVVEMGTQNQGDIDMDWIPEQCLTDKNKSPRRSPKTKTSPKTSPRQRRSKRNAGGSVED